MSISYYDSVQLNYEKKENTFSISEAIYSFGDYFSKKSSMYDGKTYTVFLEKKRVGLTDEPNLKKSYTFAEKINGHVGAFFKKIASVFNSLIGKRHELAKLFEKGETKGLEMSEVKRMAKLQEALVKAYKPEPSKINDEGYHVGRGSGSGCADCCDNCCPTDCLH